MTKHHTCTISDYLADINLKLIVIIPPFFFQFFLCLYQFIFYLFYGYIRIFNLFFARCRSCEHVFCLYILLLCQLLFQLLYSLTSATILCDLNSKKALLEHCCSVYVEFL